MQKYVLGFVFNKTRTKVALIKKERPDWQRGHWNGIGGKIETEEIPICAMEREFKEEAGVHIDVELNKWEEFAKMYSETFVVHCFKAFSDSIFFCRTMETEEVRIVDLASLQDLPILYNLNWLIPMALDNEPTSFQILY